jgi:hypothetical protein
MQRISSVFFPPDIWLFLHDAFLIDQFKVGVVSSFISQDHASLQVFEIQNSFYRRSNEIIPSYPLISLQNCKRVILKSRELSTKFDWNQSVIFIEGSLELLPKILLHSKEEFFLYLGCLMREFIQKNLLKSKRSMKWERNLNEWELSQISIFFRTINE